MDYHLTSSFFLQTLPCIFAILLILILWKRRHFEGVMFLILFGCSAAIWAIADAFEHASTTLTLKIFWYQFSILGASTIPVLFLLFTLAYTQNNKFNNWQTALILFIIPIATALLTFTNQYHHLILEKVDLITQDNSIVYHYGAWFFIYVFYELGLVISSIIILLTATLRFYDVYKSQITYLIVAPIIPLITTILFIFKLTPIKEDLTPLALVISGLFIAFGIYLVGMFDVVPIASKQIIKNLGDGIIVVDMVDRIVDANPAIEAITGMKHDGLIGKPFELMREKIHLETSDDSVLKRHSYETTLKVGHEERYIEVTYNPVISLNQKLIGKIFIFHDISGSKIALEFAVESNQRLRREIAEKEKLIADLDAYARSVAHDLKNPISGLLGMSELIKEDIINQKQEEAFELLDLAHEQSIKMYIIVDELLLLSRIRKEDIKLEILDMASIFNEALKRLYGQFAADNIKIELPQSWPKVLGHPQWIEEVWFNFISNAVKYGGVPPLIKIGYDKLNNSTYQFWIQDNGNGLPSESWLKVFNDFERLGRKNIEGNGLGLSIVKRIIEKMGGEVSVTSENVPGKGCIFSFTLKSNAEKLDGLESSVNKEVTVG
jgi:PAS domain S-box-containing protein